MNSHVLLIVTSLLLMPLLLVLLVRAIKLVFVRLRGGQPVESRSGDLLVDALRERVTKVQQTQSKLDQSRRAYDDLASMYQTIMESMPIGVVEMDEAFDVNYMNPAAQSLFKFDDDPVPNLTHVNPELDRLLRENDGGSFEFEVRLELESEAKSMLIRVASLPNHRILALFVDQTDIVRLEQRLQAQRELTLMGEMASGIAHEVKNVLGVVQARAQMIQLDNVDAGDHAQSILTECMRLEKVVRQFTQTSRDTHPEFESIPAGDWFTGIAERWRERGLEGLKFNTALEPDLILRIDPVMIDVAVDNLIRNAIDACKEGSVDDPICVEMKLKGADVVLTVEDHGPGFAPSVRDKMFVPFVTSKKQGTGLGLFHVRKIVMAHGGQIRVDHNPTRVYVVLPTTPPAAPSVNPSGGTP